MPNPISKEGEEDENGILPSIGEAVGDHISVDDTVHEALPFHLIQTAGQHSRSESRIVAKDLAEPIQFQERHVPQDKERPLSAEPPDSLPYRVRLIGQKGRDGVRLSPLPRSHYPVSP